MHYKHYVVVSTTLNVINNYSKRTTLSRTISISSSYPITDEVLHAQQVTGEVMTH